MDDNDVLIEPYDRLLLQLYVCSYTHKQLGYVLKVRPCTVNQRLARLCEKLGVRGPRALVAYAIAQDLIALPCMEEDLTCPLVELMPTKWVRVCRRASVQR